MEWGKLGLLLIVILIGYLPYKTIQRFRKDGLTSVSVWILLLMAVWFFILSFFLVLQTSNLFIKSSLFSVAFFGATAIIWFAAPRAFRRIGVYPAKTLEDNPKWFIVRLEYKTLLLKFCEVLFQQAKFAYLLFEVLGSMPPVTRIWWFTGIVSFLHLNNVLFVPSGWFFFLVSIPMGLLFGWLIIGGYIAITTTIHLWFYLLLVSWYWLRR